MNPIPAQTPWQHAQRRRRAAGLIRKVYEVGEITMLGIAALFAVEAALLIYNAPRIYARIDQQIANEIAEENRLFCEKRGLMQGTHAFTACELDLNEVRAKHDKRIDSLDLL